MHKTTMGEVRIKDADTGGDYIAAIEMTDYEGSTFSIDITPGAARDLGLDLLDRAGAELDC
jgi:hypothetical protein